MRKVLPILFLLFASNAYSERFEFTGEILEISSTQNSSNPNYGVIFINNFNSAGNCYVANSTNLIAISIKNNDQGKLQMSMALAAYMSGKQFRVRLDDTFIGNHNICYLEQIRLNDNL